MEKVYKSRVDNWFKVVCIALIVAFIGSIILCYNVTWVLIVDVVLMGLGIILIIDMWLHTDYTIKGDRLHIRCGLLFRMNLPVSKISEISHRSTILSSPALSADRIGLKYGRRNWVYVSPEDQDDFIATLRNINHDIMIS